MKPVFKVESNGGFGNSRLYCDGEFVTDRSIIFRAEVATLSDVYLESLKANRHKFKVSGCDELLLEGDTDEDNAEKYSMPDMKGLVAGVEETKEFALAISKDGGISNKAVRLGLDSWGVYVKTEKGEWCFNVKYIEFILNLSFEELLYSEKSDMLFALSEEKKVIVAVMRLRISTTGEGKG